MLVLSRKILEKVVLMVGDIEIVVTMVRVKHSGAVVLGFTAPDEVKIFRKELINEDQKR